MSSSDSEDSGINVGNARPMGSSGSSGGAKRLLILLVLVALGGGGAYYYLNMMADAPVAPRAAVPVVTADASSAAPVSAESPAMPAVPPMPDTPASTDPLDTGGNFAKPAPMEGLIPPPAAVAIQQPAAAAPVAPSADPLADPLTDPVAAVPAVPSAPPATPADPAPIAAATPPPEPPPALMPDEPEDLPLPPESLGLPPGAASAGQAPVTPVLKADDATMPSAPPAMPDKPVAAQGEQQPSAAELAIVQNAAVLDQLSQPVQPAHQGTTGPGGVPANVQDLVGQDAIIRPLPKQYLIVKKDYDSGDIDTRLTVARTALTQGRNAAALQMFNELYRDYPRDKRVLMGRAVTMQKLGQKETAFAAYEEVLNNDPKNLEALTNMLGLLKGQDPALTVEKLLQLREVYPYNADITAQLGVAYAAMGSYNEASKYLDMADTLKPGSAYVLYNKAVLYDRMGKTGVAGDLYRQLVRMAADGQLDQPLPIDAIRQRLSTLR